MNFRLIVDSQHDGPTNMARDEALLESIGSGASPPTLRFYQWSPATISLGYFQDYAEYEALAAPAGSLAVVRRQTGGGAILHDLELTYSLTVPVDHPFVAGNASRMYDRVHNAASQLLRELSVPVERGPSQGGGCSQRGPFFCFERHGPIDLLVGGRKIMGSAQRRTVHAVLQHGSLILDSRYPQQKCATLAEFASTELRVHPKTMNSHRRDAGATPLLGCTLSELILQLSRRIVGSDLVAAEFTSAELSRAGEIYNKYASVEWMHRLSDNGVNTKQDRAAD